MRQFSIASLLFFISFSLQADPWFTGPILAPNGHTIPKGHTNLELYGFDFDVDGIYDRHWKLIHIPRNQSIQFNPIVTHGFSDWFDIQLSLPYSWNKTPNNSYNRLSDVAIFADFQALTQGQARWRPDLKIAIQEIFPTGRFDSLEETGNGDDATGTGSYQTGLYFDFQHLLPVGIDHSLRTRLSLGYTYAAKVRVNGVSTYGGSANTMGKVRPGNMFSLDLAGEFTLTQHWVAVMEGYFATRGATSFSGFPGNRPDGQLAVIGHDVIDAISLAPAIEYNFSPSTGLIIGPWFTIRGRETADFVALVAALNLFF